MAFGNSEGARRVALAGFGTVGQGVYDRLKADPAHYELTAILCRDHQRRIAAGGPKELLTSDPARIDGADLFIELIGGTDLAQTLILRALEDGVDVVTANKKLVARRFDALQDAAKKSGGGIYYSAAVGGGVPMLESVAALAPERPIVRLDAVLNGTTNFVLDRIGEGLSAAEAVKEAQIAGFAEADPTEDIDGADAAEKLALLVRAAFGVPFDPDKVALDRLSSVRERDISAAHGTSQPCKQIASAILRGGSIDCSVRLRRTNPGCDLSKPKREENCLVITHADGGRTVLSGKGAGRDPTADSVLADVRRLTSLPPRRSPPAARSEARLNEQAI